MAARPRFPRVARTQPNRDEDFAAAAAPRVRHSLAASAAPRVPSSRAAMMRALAMISMGVAWLAAVAVLLVFIAGLVGVPWLIGATVVQFAVTGGAVAALLVTNTRRPWGIDPNRRTADPFGMTTEELSRGVKLPDDRHYGRRSSDDLAVVERLIRKFESEDATRPPPTATPDWAMELLQAQAEDT